MAGDEVRGTKALGHTGLPTETNWHNAVGDSWFAWGTARVRVKCIKERKRITGTFTLHF